MREAHATGDSENEALEDRLTALEQQLNALQREVTTATNRDIPLLKDTVRAMLHGEIETVDELSVAGRALGRVVVKRGERLSQLEAQVELLQQSTDLSTKTEKVATVCLCREQSGCRRQGRRDAGGDRGCTGV